MKINLTGKFFLLTFIVLTTAFITGCKTTPPVDWNSRVGSYTYDQAVIELGPPDKQATLDDGKTVAEWITHRSGGSGLSVGTGFFSGGGGSGAGVGVGQSIGSGYRDKVLKLTFDADHKLLAWSKN
ncbi:MAG: hypothetical protein WDM80_17590 [Limisphaerales bacterium]